MTLTLCRISAYLSDSNCRVQEIAEHKRLSVDLPLNDGGQGPLLLAIQDAPYPLLQYLYVFDFEVVPAAVKELLRLLNLLNKATWFSGFGFDDVENRVFFRYATPLTEDLSLEQVHFTLMGLAEQITGCADSVAAVALGEVGYQSIVAEGQALIEG